MQARGRRLKMTPEEPRLYATLPDYDVARLTRYSQSPDGVVGLERLG